MNVYAYFTYSNYMTIIFLQSHSRFNGYIVLPKHDRYYIRSIIQALFICIFMFFVFIFVLLIILLNYYYFFTNYYTKLIIHIYFLKLCLYIVSSSSL